MKTGVEWSGVRHSGGVVWEGLGMANRVGIGVDQSSGEEMSRVKSGVESRRLE